MIITSREVKRTEEVYIACDGKEFTSYDECYRHEESLGRFTDEEYFRKHSLDRWAEEWTGIGGYFDCGGNQMFLIVVDDFILEWSSRVKLSEDIQDYKGQAVFLVGSGFYPSSDWWFAGTLDNAIKDMTGDLNYLIIRRNELARK